MRKILDKHSPLKKLTEYKLKLKTKPWITSGLQKFISLKNKFFKYCINKKDLTKKTELHNKHESRRNILSTLIKKSKQNYLPSFLKDLKNLKNTWKDIKSTISVKSSSPCCPMFLQQLFQ